MKKILIACAALLSFALISCAASGLKKNEIGQWLDSKAGNKNAEINLNGKWSDKSENGWGQANLVQKGNNLSGNFGEYTIEGRVSGKTAYIVALSNDQVYYLLKLELEGNKLSGAYFYENDKNLTNPRPTSLTKE